MAPAFPAPERSGPGWPPAGPARSRALGGRDESRVREARAVTIEGAARDGLPLGVRPGFRCLSSPGEGPGGSLPGGTPPPSRPTSLISWPQASMARVRCSGARGARRASGSRCASSAPGACSRPPSRRPACRGGPQPPIRVARGPPEGSPGILRAPGARPRCNLTQANDHPPEAVSPRGHPPGQACAPVPRLRCPRGYPPMARLVRHTRPRRRGSLPCPEGRGRAGRA